MVLSSRRLRVGAAGGRQRARRAEQLAHHTPAITHHHSNDTSDLTCRTPHYTPPQNAQRPPHETPHLPHTTTQAIASDRINGATFYIDRDGQNYAFAAIEQQLCATAHAFLGSDPAEEKYEPMPFTHPQFVLYSSGTTGLFVEVDRVLTAAAEWALGAFGGGGVSCDTARARYRVAWGGG